jgi:signal transduction histidine kinase
MANRPRPIDPRSVRIACTALVVAYAAIVVLRHETGYWDIQSVRVAVVIYALAGVVLSSRFGWQGLRAYIVGLSFLLSLGAAYVGGVLGNRPADISFTALATFAPLPFLMTGRDVILVALGLPLGHALLLSTLPTPMSPLSTVHALLGGSIATGAVAGVTMIISRAGMRESMSWWQEACEREHTLREFAELTATYLRDQSLLAALADRFRTSFGGGRCVIVLADGTDDRFHVAGAAGFEAGATLMDGIPPLLDRMARKVIAARQPVVREGLDPEERRELSEAWGVPIVGRSLVAIPLTAEGGVDGVVVMSSPTARRVSDDDLQLWQAMASQAGTALANTQLVARLERALRAKGEFVNTMSHELRSPLHVIVGYADMLREGADEFPPAEAATRIRMAALELLRLVEDTMTVSRLEAGRISVRADDFEAGEVLEELADSVRALPEAKTGVPIRWESDPRLPPVRLDRLKLKEIIQNLVSNALKFTPAGEVHVSLASDDEQVRIVVKDTGIGIAPEAQGRIFDMFERVESTDGRRPPGVGLGLYIVHRLVHLMQGSIEVESAPGRGSSFIVRLPLRLERAA